MALSLSDFVEKLVQEDIEVWLDFNEDIRYRAAKGFITEEYISNFKTHKPELAQLLKENNNSLHQLATTQDASNLYEPFPLTNIQAAYLLGRSSAFEYGDVGCHGYIEFSESEVDHTRLEKAWQILIGRHPMLRAVFLPDGTQKILEEIPKFEVEIIDAIEDFYDQLTQTRSSMSHRVYDGAVWPQFGVAITQGRETAVIHISFDLLVADFVSFEMLLDELSQIYENGASLEPVSKTFREYVIGKKQNNEKANNKKRIERDEAWWSARIPTFPLKPDLPLLPKSCANKPLFERQKFRVSAENTEKLVGVSKQNSMTLSALTLAAFCEIVAKWSSSLSFALALPLFDRQQIFDDINTVVGDFTDLNLFAVNHNPNLPFLERAKQIQTQLWDDLDHRSYSGVNVARDIARIKGKEFAAFPVVYTSTIGQATVNSNLSKKWTFKKASYGITQTPQVWLDCQVFEYDGDLSINIDYRFGVFRPELISSMVESFELLLNNLALNRDYLDQIDPVELPQKQQERRNKVNGTWCQTSDCLLHERTITQCSKTSAKKAIVAYGQHLSYGALANRAYRVARYLKQKCSVNRNDLVGIALPKSVDQIVSVYGVLLSGASYVPIDVEQPAARRAKIIRSGQIKIVITDFNLIQQSWPDETQVCIISEMEESVSGSDWEVKSASKLSDLAYTIFTGGTTGTPKGVMICHRAAQNTIEDLCGRLDINEDDAILGLSQLSFDLSVFDVFAILGSGACLVLPDADRLNDPSHWVDLLQTHNITLWNSVPAQVQMLVEYIEGRPDKDSLKINLRHIMMSGDWIPVDLPARIWFLLPNVKIMSLGGATEASIWSIYHHINHVDPDKVSIPYGLPLQNQQFYVLDKGLRPRPDWVAGDLFIGGRGLANGYMANPEQTAKSFIKSPAHNEILYRTGDLGFYNDKGEIELLGREDFQVKILGHRIELREVEMVAAASDSIGLVAAVTIGEGLHKRIALAVEGKDKIPDQGAFIKEINASLQAQLPAYMIPAFIHIVDKMPLTDSNKVDRIAVEKHLIEKTNFVGSGQHEKENKPLNDFEVAFIEIFSKNLGIENIRMSDNFQSLGGNSLLAARIVTDMKNSSDLSIKLGFDEILIALLKHESLGEFRDYIAEADVQESGAGLVSMSHCGEGAEKTIVTISIDDEENSLYQEMAREAQSSIRFISLSVENSELFASLDADVLIETFADECFEKMESLESNGEVEIFVKGSRAVAGIELARRIREIGQQINRLVILPDDSLTSSNTNVWSEAIAEFIMFPYTGNVTVFGEHNYGFCWSDVVLGKLDIFDDIKLADGFYQKIMGSRV